MIHLCIRILHSGLFRADALFAGFSSTPVSVAHVAGIYVALAWRVKGIGVRVI